MRPIAQTNLQLYNQLLAQGRDVRELALVRKAYDLAGLLYSGHYQGDGKPFVCHGVGVASILAHLGLGAEMIAVGLVHNIYVNGDFGDSLDYGIKATRRRRVREAVGDRVAMLTERFQMFRIDAGNVDAMVARARQLDDTDRDLLTFDLADALEKYVDFGVDYFGDADWITDATANHGERLIEIARALDRPLLAEMLAEAFAPDRTRPAVPQALRPLGQQYLKLVVPLSCRKRWMPIVGAALHRSVRRARPRARLRRAWARLTAAAAPVRSFERPSSDGAGPR